MRLLAPQDRPREKLCRLGASSLGDNELVAVVLGHGRREVPALELANRLLTLVGGVHGLARVGVGELDQVPGVGLVKAAQVVAAVDLGRRTLLRPPPRAAAVRDAA